VVQQQTKKRKAVEKRERKAKRRRIRTIRNYALLGLAVAAGAVGVYLILAGVGKPGSYVRSLGNQHVPDPDFPHAPYNSDPPTSGPHLSYIARWGVHDEPIPKELQVHNLEDGGVIIQYNRSADPDAISKLTEIVDQYREGVILAPYPEMDSLIALTAWTRIQKLDKFDKDKIERFIRSYRGIDHHVQ
jgi:hypothetical protein